MAAKTLLDIPGEVVSHHVFKHLELNDMLRLRRVCKPMKSLASDYIRLHTRSKTELGVFVGKDLQYEMNKPKLMTIESLLQMELMVPTCKFTLVFPTVSTLVEFEAENMKTFVATFGGQIEELKMSEMSVPLSNEEIAFYESLPNLKRLTVETMDASKLKLTQKKGKDKRASKKIPKELQKPEYSFAFPSNFKRLTHFSVENYKLSSSKFTKDYIWSFLTVMENLEYFGQPKIDYAHGEKDRFICKNLDPGTYYLVQVNDIVEGQGRPLKYFDMDNFGRFEICMMSCFHFPLFCRDSGRCGLKLLNVDSRMSDGAVTQEYVMAIASVIVSLKNLDVDFLKTELPHLESLRITSSAFCALNGLENDGFPWVAHGKPQWPKLKHLELTVTSKFIVNDLPTSSLFQFLFDQIKRPSLEELTMRFVEFEIDSDCDVENEDYSYHICKVANLPTPSTKQIVSSCFNVTKLMIEGWPGKNKAILTLWEGLPNLEEVAFTDCAGLGNVAFVGEDVDKPIFLKLKKMRKLSLLHVDKMPKITDTIFHLVIRHLPLKEFYLSSSSASIPLKSITQKGIKELLNGVFAQTIEKFPFHNWALNGFSEVEMKNLSLEFRSSFMM